MRSFKERLEAQQARVSALIVAGGGVDEACRALDAQPARRIAGREAFRDWMQDLADRTLEELHGYPDGRPKAVRKYDFTRVSGSCSARVPSG